MAKWQRWIPAVAAPAVVAVVVAGGFAVSASSASAGLPEKTPQQVLELAADASVSAFSGTIEQSSDLGLPDLSSVPGGSGASGGSGSGGSGADDATATATDVLELITTDHTARVYAGGPGLLRIQVLDQLAERDAVLNGDNLWLYDSSDDTAVHATLPERDGEATDDAADATATGTLTPAELASQFLDAVDPSTDVSLGANTAIAGRDAYDLVLTPRGDDTLVGSVTIAVDAETGLPLQVQVLAKGSTTPAFSVGFSSFSLDTPSADLFDFTPPATATVTEKDAPTGDGSGHDGSRPEGSAGSGDEPTVTGTGWDAVVETTLDGDLSELTANPLFAQLATPVDGGSALQTTLVSVLLTDDGRLLAGAVPVATLQQTAAE